MAIGFSSRRLKRSAGQALTIFLLLVFMAGSTNLELFHSFAHNHDVVVNHSEDQEKDPCHRLIYHNIAELGSAHDSHLFASDKCQMCDLAQQKDQVFDPNITFAKEVFSPEYFDLYKLNLDTYWAVISSSRAPPTLS